MQRPRRGYELICKRPGVFGATDTIRPANPFPENRGEPADAAFQQVSGLFAAVGTAGMGPGAERGHCHMGRGQGRIGAGD